MGEQHDKRIRRTKRRSESRHTYLFNQINTKKISNWKPPVHERIHVFWFKKLKSIHDRLTLERTKTTSNTRTRADEKRKTTMIWVDNPQGNR